MNRDKLLGLQSRLDTNTITNADALQWLINALLEDNNVYPPESPDSSPRVDRSLRRWEEWTDEERSEFKELMRKTGFVDAIADKAIDIALRGTHE